MSVKSASLCYNQEKALIHSKGKSTWNSHIGCGVSFEAAWWAHFHSRAKTYADWLWYSSKIGELCSSMVQDWDEWSCWEEQKIIQWCPIKLRVFHRNKRCHSCPQPPSGYEWRRVQRRQLSFWNNTLNLTGHHCGVFLTRGYWFSLKALLIFDSLRPTWSLRSLQQHIVLWSDTRCLLL